MHAVDPIQRLRLLSHQLDHIREEAMPPELDFHNELTRIFNSLRDLHTAYRLPSPFREKTAWLPFFIEEIHVRGERKHIVSKVVAGAGPDTSGPASRSSTGTALPSMPSFVRMPIDRREVMPPHGTRAV
jgi:hypothetical protein